MKIIRYVLLLVKWPVIVLSSLLIFYSVAGFYILPALLKTYLPRIIEQETGKKASIERVEFQPFNLAIALQGLHIQEESHETTGIGFDDFYLQLNLFQSFHQWAIVIDEVSLKKPFVHLARQKNGVLNVTELIKNKAEPKKPETSSSVKFYITKLSLTDGTLVWDDFSAKEPFKETLNSISVSVGSLSNIPGKEATLDLALSLKSGGTLTWTGNFNTELMASEGHFQLNKAQLKVLAAPLLADLPVQLDGYELFNTHYKVSDLDNDFKLVLSEANIELRDAVLFKKEPKTELINLAKLSLQGTSVDLKKHFVHVDSLTANNGVIQLALESDGLPNFAFLLPESKSVATTTTPTPTSTIKNVVDDKQLKQYKPAWAFNIDSLSATHFSLDFEDKTLKNPVKVSLSPINIKVRDYSNQGRGIIPVQLDVGINKSGSMALKGNVVVEPFSAQLDCKIDAIDLEKFQSYYEKFVRLDVIDGALNIEGHVSVAKLAQNRPDIEFKGNVSITDFLSRDQLVNKDFLKWNKLSLADLTIDFLNNRYTASTLFIDKPYARVAIRKDKTANFNDIVRQDDSAINTVAESKREDSVNADTETALINKPYFKLDNIQIREGFSDFSDRSLILPFAAQIQSIDGGAKDISSEKKSTIKLSLQGNAYDLSPVDIKGDISPFLSDYQIMINFKGLPMPLISPYMVQFAGYKVEKGKMTLGLKYNVVSSELSAFNSIVIDQFELGEAVENPNAINLPIKLAVALLKDGEGKIKIEVPIRGSLNDPQFDIGEVVSDALLNILKKVVTSPFRALGLLAGSEKDLSVIGFTPGSAVLKKSEQEKLTALAKALIERPMLNLDIKGAAFQEQDWPIIREDALYEQLKKRKAREMNKNSEKKIREEYIELSDLDYKRLLAEMFIENFPRLAEKSILGQPKLITPGTGDFYEVAREKLFTIIKPEQDRLKGLALARAQAIANYVAKEGKVLPEKIYILDTVIDPALSNKELVSALSLTVN